MQVTGASSANMLQVSKKWALPQRSLQMLARYCKATRVSKAEVLLHKTTAQVTATRKVSPVHSGVWLPSGPSMVVGVHLMKMYISQVE